MCRRESRHIVKTAAWAGRATQTNKRIYIIIRKTRNGIYRQVESKREKNGSIVSRRKPKLKKRPDEEKKKERKKKICVCVYICLMERRWRRNLRFYLEKVERALVLSSFWDKKFLLLFLLFLGEREREGASLTPWPAPQQLYVHVESYGHQQSTKRR